MAELHIWYEVKGKQIMRVSDSLEESQEFIRKLKNSRVIENIELTELHVKCRECGIEVVSDTLKKLFRCKCTYVYQPDQFPEYWDLRRIKIN